VLELVEVPPGLVAVGLADGTFGLWEMQTGDRVDAGKLHGPVKHMLLDGGRLVVVTELGDHVVWDLGVLFGAYCDLLRELWRQVPFDWEKGRAVVRPPPHEHPCAMRSARR
jgi:hypothetical protein